MKRFRLSTLLFAIVIAAFCIAVVVQHDRASRLEATASRRAAELQAALQVMKMTLAPNIAPAAQPKLTCDIEENGAETKNDAGLADARGYDDHKINELVKKLGELEDPYRSAQAYRSLFATAGADALSRLQIVDDDSIAIQSAWEAVALTVPVKNGDSFYRPDAQKLNWFLGFLQGRTRVSPPDWWREVVLDARANRRNNIYHGDPKSVPYRRRTGIDRVTCPKNASVQKNGDSIVYRVGEAKISIPEELKERGNHGTFIENVSGSFTDKHCFLALHDPVGYPHKVGCIDRTSGKLVWKATVCGSWWGDSSGSFESWVAVVPTGDGRVFVFGAAGGLYLQGFRATDGQSLVRFSTNF